MGAEGQLIKLSYHCKPFKIHSKYLSLQQKNKKIKNVVTRCNLSSVITGGARERALPGEWWCFPRLSLHWISLLACVWHVWRGEVRHVLLTLSTRPPQANLLGRSVQAADGQNTEADEIWQPIQTFPQVQVCITEQDDLRPTSQHSTLEIQSASNSNFSKWFVTSF